MKLWISVWTFVLLSLSGCSDAGRVSREFGVTMLETPAGPGSGESRLAMGPDGTVVLSWLAPDGAGHALPFATLGDSGWSSAYTVARGANWFVNWADFPSVVPLSESFWAAHWLARQPAGGYAYDVVMSLSADGGATWNEYGSPHTDGTPTQHGFVTLFSWQDGVGVVWLDGRETLAAAKQGSEAPGRAGSGMTLRSAIVGARSSAPAIDVDDAKPLGRVDAVLLADGDAVVSWLRPTENDAVVALRRVGRDGTLGPLRVVARTAAGRLSGFPQLARSGADLIVSWTEVAGVQSRIRSAGVPAAGVWARGWRENPGILKWRGPGVSRRRGPAAPCLVPFPGSALERAICGAGRSPFRGPYASATIR